MRLPPFVWSWIAQGQKCIAQDCAQQSHRSQHMHSVHACFALILYDSLILLALSHNLSWVCICQSGSHWMMHSSNKAIPLWIPRRPQYLQVTIVKCWNVPESEIWNQLCALIMVWDSTFSNFTDLFQTVTFSATAWRKYLSSHPVLSKCQHACTWHHSDNINI